MAVAQDFKKHLSSMTGKPHAPREASAKPPIMHCWGLIALAATVWFTLYNVIQTFANWITYGLECLRQPASLDESILFCLSLAKVSQIQSKYILSGKIFISEIPIKVIIKC